ncbi:class F sortase [Streptomyces sp. NPDC000229]|uniref:class F sortase n=1 Tax=Streptomyces sp. NPDC000229 TaxID=3154247 RepID=UPI003316BBE0
MTFLAHGSRRGVCTAAATLCATAGTVLLAVAFVPGRQPPPEPPSPATQHTQLHTHAPSHDVAVLPPSEPVRITAKRIGLAASVEAVGIAKDGTVAMPTSADHAGWYTGSVTPGERGNAILAAHLDSTTGPAAFYSLGALREGDRITVRRRDGTDAVFTVTAMNVYDKSAFPSQAVYGPTPHPQLTLITCADWDPEARTYRANLVITAHTGHPTDEPTADR